MGTALRYAVAVVLAATGFVQACSGSDENPSAPGGAAPQSSGPAGTSGATGTSGTPGAPGAPTTSGATSGGIPPGGDAGPGGPSGGDSGGGTPADSGPPTNPDDGPAAGNPAGNCTVPAEAQAESIASSPTVVGAGTPESCTSAAFVAAVKAGGVITFNCGANPTKIDVTETAWVYNDKGPVVIDGGGKVTLSGGGNNRILMSNACDPSHGGYSSGVSGVDCNGQVTPKVTIQNITFVDGHIDVPDVDNAGGGGAIWIRGGRTKIVNARFFHNTCTTLGSDVGGGAVRILDFPVGGSVDRPVYVVNSTFGGKTGFGNSCANGGALSSIGTSWSIYNSLFTDNTAVGMGANSGQGGNGGAIYNDGNTIALKVCGAAMHDNHANEGGSAIFFVSNDHSGTIAVTNSVLTNNPKGNFQTLPGIYVIAKDPADTTGSTIQ